MGKFIERNIKAFRCHVWAAFMVNIITRIAGKLRGIILRHLGLITVRFRFGRTLKPLMFMISEFLNVSMTPKTNYFHFWRHQDTQNSSRKILNSLCNILFWEIS